jgi:hypothetical protein
MKKLNYEFLILIAIFPLFLISIVQTVGEEVDEGHLYHVEIEENQILEENLKRLLDQDKKRVWNNCFSDESSSKEKNILEKEEEKLYSREDN